MEQSIAHPVVSLPKENAYTNGIVLIGIHRYALSLQNRVIARHLTTAAIHNVRIHTTTTTDVNFLDHHRHHDRRHHDTPDHNPDPLVHTQADIQHLLHRNEPVHHTDDFEVPEDEPMQGTYSIDITGAPNTPHLRAVVIATYHLTTRPTLAGRHLNANAITNSNLPATLRTALGGT